MDWVVFGIGVAAVLVGGIVSGAGGDGGTPFEGPPTNRSGRMWSARQGDQTCGL